MIEKMKNEKIKFEISSDVSSRDGVSVEVFRNEEMIIDIFRDDTERTRTVTLFSKDIPLDLMEKSIQIFKDEIKWDFINYDDLIKE